MKLEQQLWRLKGLRFGAGVLCVGAALGGQIVWGHAQAAPAPIVFSDTVWQVEPSAYVDSRDYLVADAALLSVAEGARATFTGNISNQAGSPEGLMKLGAGALTLSGSNTYRGVTHVLQGELQVAGDQAIGAGGLQVNTGTVLSYAPGVTVARNLQMQPVAMASQPLPPPWRTELPGKTDTVRWHVESGQATHAGVLSGSADFDKTGAGRLSLNYDALAYTGNAVVKEGTLAVNELFSGSVQVDSGARLEGTGSIASVWVRDGGTLAPGASIGVLRIPGDLRFDPGSVLALEVDADGQHDSLRVGGKAFLAGTVQAQAGVGDWQPATSYRFLTATGGFDGTRFNGVSSNFAFLTPSLSYDETSVTLTLARNDTPLKDPAITPDEVAVADVIDDAPGMNDLPQLYDAIVVLDRNGARSAYQQLGGAWAATVRSSQLDDSRFVREAVFDSRGSSGDRLASGRAGQMRADQKMWAQAYHADGRGDAAGSAPSYSRVLRGFTAGSRHLWRNLVAVGGFIGAQHRQLAQRDGDGHANSRIQSVHAGLDAGWSNDTVQADLGLAVAWQQVKTDRRVQVGGLGHALHSAYRTRTAQLFGQLALKGPIAPFVQLAVVHHRTPAYSETGSAAALRYSPAKDLAVYMNLGVKALAAFTTALGPGNFSGELAWQHAQGERQLVSKQAFDRSRNPTEFSSHGQGLPANALKARITVSTALGRYGQLQAGYSGLLAPGRLDHGLMLQVRHRF